MFKRNPGRSQNENFTMVHKMIHGEIFLNILIWIDEFLNRNNGFLKNKLSWPMI